MQSYSLPSHIYDSLTLGASGSTYTAPADGYFFLNKIIGNTAYYIRIAVEGSRDIWANAGYSTTPATILFPVRKGETVVVNYNATGTTNGFRFIYAAGSEPQT